jgi:hypothetical protein
MDNRTDIQKSLFCFFGKGMKFSKIIQKRLHNANLGKCL